MKNNLLIVFTVLLLSSETLVAQTPTIQWQKTFGGTGDDYLWSTQQTLDGGYIVAGQTSSFDGDVIGNNGSDDFWVLKLDNQGAIQWEKTLGGTGIEIAYSIHQTTDGGYLLAGETYSNDGDVSDYQGNGDVWVVKLDFQGVIQWQKTLGGSGVDFAFSIQSTLDGGCVLTGGTTSSDGDVIGLQGGYDFWVLKLDSQGAIQWQKTLGGTGNDYALNIQLTVDGGYVVAGKTNSTNGDVTGNHGNNDFWIVKINDLGVLIWQKTLGGTGNDTAFSIQQTAEGAYIVAGQTTSTNGDVTDNHGGFDVWVVKLDEIGAIQWQKTLGGTGTDYVSSIQKKSDGGIIIGGETTSTDGDIMSNQGSSDCWAIELNSLGEIQWQKTLGGTGYDSAQSVQQTIDGGFVVAGFSNSTNGDITNNKGGYDFWVVKLSSSALQFSDFESNLVSISPNPAINDLNIQFKNTQNLNGGTINIINSMGQLAATTPIILPESNSMISIDKFGSSGLYFVQIINAQGQIVDNKKIILR